MSSRLPYVAIVDDDASVRTALSRLLDASAFKPQAYPSAGEFLQSLADTRPECLILDLQMPEMSGFELHCALLRAGLNIPTIVITANHDQCRRERVRATVAEYLLKPLDQATLISAINRVVGRSSPPPLSGARAADHQEEADRSTLPGTQPT
jgi:FixJ family two-component response regulator